MDLSGPLPDATVICTLGMHRSGTSMVARMLNLLGVHLGPDARVLTAGDDNPKGYWEHRPVVDINDAILAAFGGQWDAPPDFPADWPRDPRIAALRERARDLLTEDFAAAPLWGWKDPRTCLTLPFWQDLIGPMRYVLCVRNPCAVVASLMRRSGMRAEQAERLWLVHLHAILAHTSGQPRLFVSYEDIIAEWLPELRRMAAFIGHPERAEDPEVHDAVRAFLDRELCHHRMSIDDLAGDRRTSFPTKSLYFAVRGYTGARSRTNKPQGGFENTVGAVREPPLLDLLGTQALDAWDRTAAIAAERDALAAHCQALLAKRLSLTHEHETVIAERDALVPQCQALFAERGDLTREYRAVLAHRDALMSQYQAVLADRDALLPEYRAVLAHRDALLSHYEALLAERGHLTREYEAVLAHRDAILPQYQALLAERGNVDREYQAVLADRDTLGRAHHALCAERDRLARENDAHDTGRAALSAERDRLASEAAALGENTLALSAECRELGVREQRALQSIAGLESERQSMTLDRDAQARTSSAAMAALDEIHTSSAWRLVTFSRDVVNGFLPAGTRRRRLFNTMIRRIANRLPSSRARKRGVVDFGAV